MFTSREHLSGVKVRDAAPMTLLLNICCVASLFFCIEMLRIPEPMNWIPYGASVVAASAATAVTSYVKNKTKQADLVGQFVCSSMHDQQACDTATDIGCVWKDNNDGIRKKGCTHNSWMLVSDSDIRVGVDKLCNKYVTEDACKNLKGYHKGGDSFFQPGWGEICVWGEEAGCSASGKWLTGSE